MLSPIQSKTARKTVPFQWGPEQEQTFNHLKELLTSSPILGYADYRLPFELHTDASTRSRPLSTSG